MASPLGNQGTVSSLQTSEAFVVVPSDSLLLEKVAGRGKQPWVVFNNSTAASTVKVDTYYGDVGITYEVAAGAVVGVGMQISRVYDSGSTITGNLIAQR